ncbi:hypothetical protein ACHQM5_023309 [Ranunculus cassubicifolius]
MGICSSYESASIATAKLILEDGQPQEFPYSLRVSYLLQKQPLNFICDSDSMEFEGFVTALRSDEVLEPGHLYFSLPLSKLKHPLQAEEMAALAVKASLALTKSGNGYCLKEMDPEVHGSYSGREKRGLGVDVGKSRRSCSRSSGHNFRSSLTMIQE